uniref:Uncharacterized protein n=1 Tax=Candidatus Kentrum eta TaxID=2126337 RepID=A0A450V7E5_9GAMM|nr:MAG: hypothetical protein BECKH772A_GA0070896_1005311 [Candidatus Kentron sp. H]VFJ94044.1 MAG: hypothetical protein BECKH772B_GA0070898_1005411 [Candidatus Kentron sp. H]VFK00708.1 MAG: hypothetical protein BECKH772C_GA0070978_1005111 [Candidatus Kentron sp. H]
MKDPIVTNPHFICQDPRPLEKDLGDWVVERQPKRRGQMTNRRKSVVPIAYRVRLPRRQGRIA